MSGFGPVGSFPVASMPDGGPDGTYFTITEGNVTATGHLYTLTYTFPASRISQVSVEVLHPGVPDARISQFSIEVLTPGVPEARISQMAIEVLRSIATAQTDGGYVSILW